MILILVPPGRGNWSPITIAIEGRHAVPLGFKRGDAFPLGGVIFTISKVLP